MNKEIIYVLTNTSAIVNGKERRTNFNVISYDKDIIYKNGILCTKRLFSFMKFKYNLENNCIYKLKVKKINDNFYEIIKVLESNCNHTKLNEIKNSINEGYTTRYEDITFKLDSNLMWYEGKYKKITINIGSNNDNIFELCENKKYLKELINDDFLIKLKKEISSKELEDAKDWNNENIDENQINNRISLESINIGSDIKLYYNDDNIFAGHLIEVTLNNNLDIDKIDIVD